MEKESGRRLRAQKDIGRNFMKKRPVLVIALGGAVLMVLVLVFFAGMKFAVPDAEEQEKDPLLPSVSIQQGREKVFLYFSDPEENYLTAEIREVSLPEAGPERAKKLLEVLFAGPTDPLVSVIPQDTRLLALYFEGEIAIVDLSAEIRENHPKSSHTEMLTLSSIANTLIQNVPEIRGVKVLVNGQEEDSLAGHAMIQYPITANMTIVR